jgi:hypothetical protein
VVICATLLIHSDLLQAIYRSQDINMSNEDYMNHYTYACAFNALGAELCT